MSSTPFISVVVCTYRRPSSLRIALESLGAQTCLMSRWELLVVDNGSGDGTEDVVRTFAEAEPELNVRYVLEETPGLSVARNAGIAAAEGEIIAFLDDDVVVEPGWLSALAAAYTMATEAAAVGGPVRAQWLAPRPTWLDDSFLPSLSVKDLGGTFRRLRSTERLVGANMSFRRDILEAGGGFSTRLGRHGQLLLDKEDIELQDRLFDNGSPVFYAPDAVVHHRIPLERMSRRYFVRRAHGSGRSEAVGLALRCDGGGLAWHVVRSMAHLVLDPLAALVGAMPTFRARRGIAFHGAFLQQTARLLIEWAHALCVGRSRGAR